jgi:citrate lyase beta subunit
MSETMRTVRFAMPDEVAALNGSNGPAVVDLAEFAHPQAATAAARELGRLAGSEAGRSVALLLPATPDPEQIALASRLGVETVILNRVQSAGEVANAAASLIERGSRASLVLRLSSGAGLHRVEELATAGARVRGIWYAAADLLVDFDEEPEDLYIYDSDETRLAAPSWVRSRCLTVARAFRLELWGQLDLTFAQPPARDAALDALRLARLSGFDVIATRHSVA